VIDGLDELPAALASLAGRGGGGAA
jgi:hypothetical protein